MTYMSEIAMPQVRGALLGAFALSFGLGQLFNAVGFQILAEVSVTYTVYAYTAADEEQTNPEKYLNGIYSQFVMLGLFAIVTLIIPESPGKRLHPPGEILMDAVEC